MDNKEIKNNNSLIPVQLDEEVDYIIEDNSASNRKCPKTYLAESVISTVICFPFGLAGLYYATKVQSLFNRNLYDESLKASKSAKRFFIISVIVSVIFYTLVIIFVHKQVKDYATYLDIDETEINAPVREWEESIPVSCDGKWEVRYKPSWIRTYASKDRLYITTFENETGEHREGEVIISAGSLERTIPVVQSGYATYLKVVPNDTVHFEKWGGFHKITVQTDGKNYGIGKNSSDAIYSRLYKLYPEGKLNNQNKDTLTLWGETNDGSKVTGYLIIQSDSKTVKIPFIQEGECSRCEGHGRIDCPSCNGTQRVSYSTTYWNGWFWDWTTNTRDCTRCEYGRIDCPDCGGSGIDR